MSTKALVAVGDLDRDFEGRYVHFDGYPSAAGATILREARRQGPAWIANLTRHDWSAIPNWNDDPDNPGRCYCCTYTDHVCDLRYEDHCGLPHAACDCEPRRERITDPWDRQLCDLESYQEFRYAYLIGEDATLRIYDSFDKQVGAWKQIAAIDIRSDDVPDWSALDQIEHVR